MEKILKTLIKKNNSIDEKKLNKYILDKKIPITYDTLKYLLTNENSLLKYTKIISELLFHFNSNNIFIDNNLFDRFINILFKNNDLFNDETISNCIQNLLISTDDNNIFTQNLFEKLFLFPKLFFLKKAYLYTTSKNITGSFDIYVQSEVINKFISHGCIYNINCLENSCTTTTILDNDLCRYLSEKNKIEPNHTCFYNILKVQQKNSCGNSHYFILDKIKCDHIGFDIYLNNTNPLNIADEIFITDLITYTIDDFKKCLKNKHEYIAQLMIQTNKIIADYSLVVYTLQNGNIYLASQILKQFNITPKEELYDIFINLSVDTFGHEFNEFIDIMVAGGFPVNDKYIQMAKHNNNYEILLSLYDKLSPSIYKEEYLYDACKFHYTKFYFKIIKYFQPSEKCIDNILHPDDEMTGLIQNNPFEYVSHSSVMLLDLLTVHNFILTYEQVEQICDHVQFYSSVIEYIIDNNYILKENCVNKIIDTYITCHTNFNIIIKLLNTGIKFNATQIDEIINQHQFTDLIKIIKQTEYKLTIDQLKNIEGNVKNLTQLRFFVKNTI